MVWWCSSGRGSSTPTVEEGYGEENNLSAGCCRGGRGASRASSFGRGMLPEKRKPGRRPLSGCCGVDAAGMAFIGA